MGKLLNEGGKPLFPEKMALLSHWNLRDEIKANYGNKETGKEKQEMIFKVMERIINQDIPEKVINNPNLQWAPYSNKVFENNREIVCPGEPDRRYQQILNNFNAEKAIDAYSPEMNTFIARKFSGEMEIPQEEVEALFDGYLRSPQLAKIGAIIEKRLGRSLRPYDIWYDGFKSRSSFPQEELDGKNQIALSPIQMLSRPICPGCLPNWGGQKRGRNTCQAKSPLILRAVQDMHGGPP